MALRPAAVALLAIGAASIIAGITLIYPPAGLIVGGALCILATIVALVDVPDGDRR